MDVCLGLHHGHDASVCVVSENGIEHYAAKERSTRCKHALGLSADDFARFLGPHCQGIGLSGTQDLPLFSDEQFGLEVENSVAYNDSDAQFWSRIPADFHYFKYIGWDPAFRSRRGVMVPESTFPWIIPTSRGANTSYEAMAMVSSYHPEIAAYFDRPAGLHHGGTRYAAHFYHHHLLHAQYACWAAGANKPALVLSQDGGAGPSFGGGGIYFYSPEQGVLPVTPCDGWLGQFYDNVGGLLGLGNSGAAGKLMGLAPYGRPWLDISTLIGTRHQVTLGYQLSIDQLIQRWLAHHGIEDYSTLRWDTRASLPPPLVADIAASAQLVVEVNMGKLLRAATEIAAKCRFDYAHIVLSGGLSLNCPSNSNLSVAAAKEVIVPPACNDEGLSIGAAVLAFKTAHGVWPKSPADYAQSCFLGQTMTQEQVHQAAAQFGFTTIEGDAVQHAAQLLANDEIVAVASGRSEIGPRALGHRSILANPRSAKSWAQVNRIKGREAWRPFAPAVLDEDAALYFDRGPASSRFMLFNYRCTSKEFPAITHYDHSSRAQCVSAPTGLLHSLLCELKTMGLPPVLMNTSFNGPGVPIVETAADSFGEAHSLGLRYLLTDFGLYQCTETAGQ